MQWDLFDYVVMGGLLAGAFLLYKLVTTKVAPKRRGLVVIVMAAGFLLVWVELAVGIFGSPIAGS